VLRLRVGTYVRWFLGEGKGDIDAAGRRLGIFAAARGDDNELAAVHFEGSGSRVGGEGKRCFPKQLTGGFIEGAELLVEVGCSDEQQSACANNGTAVIFRAGVLLAFCRKLRVFAERNLPDIFAGVQIDSVQSAPRRSYGGIAFRVEKFVVAGEAIGHGRGRRCGACQLFAFAAQQKTDERGALILVQVWKARHSSFSVLDGRRNLRGIKPLAHSYQVRHAARRTAQIFSVADAALAHIDGARAIFAGVRGERARPCDVIRIDVDDSGLCIHGGAAPFRATVEAGKNYRIFSYAEWNELPFTAEFLEFFQRPLMCFRRAHGQQVYGEKLARKRRGACRKRLFGSRNFAGYGARWIFAGLDGEKRPSVDAVEEIDESLFCCLRYGIDFLSVTLHGDERRRGREVAVPKIVADSLKMPDSLARPRIQGNSTI